MYLHLCKVFDMAPYHVLTSELERYGFVGWTIWWIRNGWMVAAVVNSSTSRWRLLRSGVPQQSMWGPVFVNILTNSTGVGIKCTHSKFAEDTRLGSGQAWIHAQTGRRTWEKPWRKGLEEKLTWASRMQSQPGRPGVLWAASTEGCKQAVGGRRGGPSTGKLLNIWRQSREGLQRWSEGWNNSLTQTEGAELTEPGVEKASSWHSSIYREIIKRSEINFYYR